MAPKKTATSAATANTAAEATNPPRPTQRSTPVDLPIQHHIAPVEVDTILVERQARLEAAVGGLQGEINGVAATLREIMQRLPIPPPQRPVTSRNRRGNTQRSQSGTSRCNRSNHSLNADHGRLQATTSTAAPSKKTASEQVEIKIDPPHRPQAPCNVFERIARPDNGERAENDLRAHLNKRRNHTQ